MAAPEGLGVPNTLTEAVRSLPPSATLRINEMCNKMIAEGRKVYKWGLGQSPFPVPNLVVQSLQQHAAAKDYLPVAGLPELRETVAEFMTRTRGVAVSSEQVIIGPGSKELLFLTQLALNSTLYLPVPSWVTYEPQSKVLHTKCVWVPAGADGHFVDLEHLDQACSRADKPGGVLILNYPNNPTGQTLNADGLQKLAAVCRKHRLAVISDEIYSLLHHHNEHISLVKFYPEGTIVTDGLSKWCGAGGWRLGVAVFPRELDWLRDAIKALASETFSSVSAPVQHAAVTAFRFGPEMQAFVQQQQRILRALGRELHAIFTAAGLGATKPEGGFYTLLDFSPKQDKLAARGLTTSPQVTDAILADTGVAFLPASHFGVSPAKLQARVAWVNFDGAAALQAAASCGTADTELTAEWVQELCPHTLEAAHHVADWFAAL